MRVEVVAMQSEEASVDTVCNAVESELAYYPVPKAVGSVRNDRPQLVRPIASLGNEMDRTGSPLTPLDLSGDVESLIDALHWSEQPAYFLSARAFATFLRRLRAGEMSGEIAQRLAERMEINESIVVEGAAEDLVSSVLFHLATPEINPKLTQEELDLAVRQLEAIASDGFAS